MIELYIENKLIELEDNLEVDFTYETLDPNKLASIKNSFSKTVKVPGTPSNNKTFGHIFRNDKYIPVRIPGQPIDAFYDPHKKISWLINKNGAVVQRGYCTLDSVDIEDNRKIYYNLTLYGGLGEFFYALAYNEADGSAKTLKDVFFNWRPTTSLGVHGAAMSSGEEQTNTLMTCSSSIIANAYHALNPYYTYSGATDIDKDVVFVPCYTGLYNDFDSKHMIVSTFNQNYAQSPMSTQTKNNLFASFPERVDEDGNIIQPGLEPSGTYYSTLDAQYNSSGAYRYGLATFSRDIEPSEAADLRVNELPVAIRLSKLLWAITRPENCGGYEVEWSPTILNSLHFLYGWVLLGKLQTTLDTLAMSDIKEYAIGNKTISYAPQNQGSTSTTTADLYATLYNSTLGAYKYVFKLEVKPKFTFTYRLSPGSNHPNVLGYDWGTQSYFKDVQGSVVRNYWSRFNVFVVFTKFISGNIVKKQLADVFFYTTNDDYTFGANDPFHNAWEYKEALKAKLANYIQQDIDKVTIHNCMPYLDSYTVVNGVYTANMLADNEMIETTIEHTGSNLRIEQQCTLAFITWGSQSQPKVGIWGEDNPYDSSCSFNLSFFGRYSGRFTSWTYGNPPDDYIFSYDTVSAGLFLAENTGFNIIQLDKKTLFASSDSPFKYLADYCKMMDYKFICDHTQKRIQILPSNEYYKDSAIDINNLVDYKRQISIKPVVTKDKLIEIGLKPLDTYPIELVNRKQKHEFNIKKFDTGIEYAATNSKMLDNLVFKSTLDWQLHSIFFNIYPQYPKPYNLPTVAWTLFNYADSKLDKKEFIFTTSEVTSTNQAQSLDWLPKLGLFDKSSKYVNGTTLLFLNGFVKNYDYVEGSSSQSTPEPISPDETLADYYIPASAPSTKVSNGEFSIYTYTIIPNATYTITGAFQTGYDYYMVNYFDSNGHYISSQFNNSSRAPSNTMLTIPSNAHAMLCNFLNKDNTKQMMVSKSEGGSYVIAPRLMFSNDTPEQYYLNDGQRCYVSDFKYNDNFRSWGCYSSDQKGVATSWTLPMFTRDLFNLYIQDIQAWNFTAYKMASWNLVDQEALDNVYSLVNTTFIYNPSYSYSKTSTGGWDSNEYAPNTDNIPQDFEGETERIYDMNWANKLSDIYSRNSREATLWVDLSKMPDPNNTMRQTYIWEGAKWIITKIYNYKLSDFMVDKFTKVTMKKIDDIANWI